jgi:hypothetical protein
MRDKRMARTYCVDPAMSDAMRIRALDGVAMFSAIASPS